MYVLPLSSSGHVEEIASRRYATESLRNPLFLLLSLGRSFQTSRNVGYAADHSVGYKILELA